ncbi:class I adenylate-forming enzyme family protein [Streptomyces sp. NPDC001941]|uniref:class I adenylate-forming enzyme family protein n=1 Tax=Streptomyces sp. NPDC001941 TaxID=3154659 RepID=UPI00332AAA3F
MNRGEAVLTGPGAPFEVVDGVYAGGARTLREFVEVTWALGDRPFLVAEGGVWSYREFFDEACGLARALLGRYGAVPGDRVALAARNLPEWQIAFWAVQLAGLVAVPLNAWWGPEETAYALDDCEPSVLLVDDERVAGVEAWARGRGVPVVVMCGEVRGHHAYVPDRDPYAGPPDLHVLPEHDSTLIYTSGTTGRPKGAVATHLAQAGAAMNPRFHAALAALERGEVPGSAPPPVFLVTFPFFHVAAFTSVYSVMASGGALVMMRKWDARQARGLIREHRVTHFSGVPTTALRLLRDAEEAVDPMESLRHLNTGGAPAPPVLLERLARVCGERVEPRTGYGLTETCGGVLASSGAGYRADPAGAGRPSPVTEVRVDAPEGEPGELLLRGQSLVRGYWRDEAATRAAFTPDGWLRTGDLAVLRDGRVSVVDRIKDVILRGGENVYCVEVEGVLLDHPAVRDAAVLGVPHPELGEEVAAVVRLAEGAAATAEELRAYAAGRLAAFKVPALLFVRTLPLPRNATGKVLKRQLKEEVAGA